MDTRKRYAAIIALALLGGVVLVTATWAAPGTMPLAGGGAPTLVAYQGEVRVGGVPYTGDGYFKFAIVNTGGDISYWSNDGTSSGGNPPSAAVPLAVSDGLFSVLLGDATLPGMNQPLTADVFGQPDRYLRVWFSTGAGGPFDLLAPDTRVAAVPYALQAQGAVDADTVDGLHASELGTHAQNVVVVAKSGGDYANVQPAIDSITEAAADNAYLVWVAPGVYEEQVTMKPYVHLQGAGQEATIITSAASDSAWPPAQATLVLASDASLRDLAVGNSGAGDMNTALLATAGMTRTLVADVTARAQGDGVSNLAIVLSGSGTGITLQAVTALAENGSSHGVGLVNTDGAAAMVHGGTFTGRGGVYGWGILSSGSGTTLKAMDITALGENGSDLNQGLHNSDGSRATLHGGVFTGRGGNQTGGVSNTLGSTLMAEDITTLAEDGTENYGLGNYDDATMTVHGAGVTARGGVNNYALSNEFNVTMQAEGVTALAENGSGANYGLWNVNNGQATVRGGSFTGRGGTSAHGIANIQAPTTLEAESVTALAEDGSEANYGLYNWDGAAATLHGGSLTARGGTNAWGIYNSENLARLEAEGVTAQAEGASIDTFGLHNDGSAMAWVHGGSFIAQGGAFAKGIFNSGTGTTLRAMDVNALGVDASDANYGLLIDNDNTVTMLRGGTFAGHAGTIAYGIENMFSGPMLEADDISATAGGGSQANYGLRNRDGAAARLRGGTFTAHWGITNCAIYNADTGTWLEAYNVSALAENSSDESYGLHNRNGAGAWLSGSSFTARGGEDSFAIHNAGSGTTMQADDVTAIGEIGNNDNYGLRNSSAAWARLHGGAFLASGGMDAHGIYNADSDSWLEVDNATALAEDGDYNYGLVNLDAAAATLRGGSFTGKGGLEDWGILNHGSGTTLEAENVNALAENDSATYGLDNAAAAQARLRGGTFIGRGGSDAYGIYNTGIDTWLEAENISVLAENSIIHSYGLYNLSYAAALLRGGAFTGRGGTEARGVCNDSGAMLEADNVTALGEDGSSYSHGLVNFGTATLRDGVFAGRAGVYARGIYNSNGGVTLVAQGITALGVDGSSANYGLYNYATATADVTQGVLEGATNSVYHDDSGSVTVSNSRLVGNPVFGAVTCVAVSRGGTFNANGCP
jgi:hypothetical protein